MCDSERINYFKNSNTNKIEIAGGREVHAKKGR